MPGASPGRSAIATAIYPERIGTISEKPMAPMALIWNQKLSAGITSPAAEASPPNDSEIAISSPPTTTNGIMWETPFIRDR